MSAGSESGSPAEARSDSWGRTYYASGGGDAWLYYCVFGDFADRFECDYARYRTAGVPPGLSVQRVERAVHPERFDVWLNDYFGRQLEAVALGPAVRSAPQMLVVSGAVVDPPNLMYLRDVVGLISFLLDEGGVAVLDAQILRWWPQGEWTDSLWAPDGPVPLQHTVILYSGEEDEPSTEWFHTRGIRKFGRPDLSVRHVPPVYRGGVIDLFNRFIEYQAFGGVIREGEAIRMRSLPEGMTCHYAGDIEDPDFNNLHVEIRWPSR